MRKRTLFCHGLLTAAMLGLPLLFTACTSKEDNPVHAEGEPVKAPDGYQAEIYAVDVKYDKEAVMVGAVDFDVTTALNKILTKQVTEVTDDTRLIVLNDFNDLDSETVLDAFENGATFALVNPTAAKLAAFAELDEELTEFTENMDLDNILIYAFNNHYLRYTVNKVTDEDIYGKGGNPDALVREDYFLEYLAGWIRNLKVAEQEDAEDEEAARAENPDKEAVEAFSIRDHVGTTLKFSKYERVHKVWLSDPDMLYGEGSISVLYSVYIVHTYEGVPSAGNYYMVSMHGSIANEKMWNDVQSTWHGGIRSTYCGFIGKDVTFRSALYKSNSPDKPADVQFIAEAFPQPATTQGATSYTSAQSFGMGLGVSVGRSTISKNPSGKANDEKVYNPSKKTDIDKIYNPGQNDPGAPDNPSQDPQPAVAAAAQNVDVNNNSVDFDPSDQYRFVGKDEEPDLFKGLDDRVGFLYIDKEQNIVSYLMNGTKIDGQPPKAGEANPPAASRKLTRAAGDKTQTTLGANVSANWGWSESKSRSVSDLEIQNLSSDNVAEWKLVFKNNEPTYNASVWMDPGPAQTYRATAELDASWIWYDKNAKDNNNEEPLWIYFWTHATWMSVGFEIADWPTRSINNHDYYGDAWLRLHAAAETREFGKMVLKNDYTDKYIHHIQVIDVSSPLSPVLVFEDNNSYAPGSKLDLGTYLTSSKFTVTYRANKAREIPTIYKYDMNNWVVLKKDKIIELNCAPDFGIQGANK